MEFTRQKSKLALTIGCASRDQRDYAANDPRQETVLTLYNELASRIIRSLIDTVEGEPDALISERVCHDIQDSLRNVRDIVISGHRPVELANMISVVPDLGTLDVPEEFYGAPATFLLRSVLRSALHETFKPIYAATSGDGATYERLRTEVEKVLAHLAG